MSKITVCALKEEGFKAAKLKHGWGMIKQGLGGFPTVIVSPSYRDISLVCVSNFDESKGLWEQGAGFNVENMNEVRLISDMYLGHNHTDGYDFESELGKEATNE